MVEALKTLNVKLEEDWDNKTITVHGCGGRFDSEGAELFLGNAGTAMRCVLCSIVLHALLVCVRACAAALCACCGMCGRPAETAIVAL